jgi:hypothetical protein
MRKEEFVELLHEKLKPFIDDCHRRLDAIEARQVQGKAQKSAAVKAQIEQLASDMAEIKARQEIQEAKAKGFSGILGANRHVRTLKSPDAGGPFRGSILPHVEKANSVTYDTSGLPSALASGSLNHTKVKKSEGDGDFSGMDNLMFGCPWS